MRLLEHYPAMQTINERRERLKELICSASYGSEPAFAELYDMTHTYLYYVALRVLNSAPHAEEVLQEAYLCIWQQAHRFDPHLGSAMSWLITVVRNHAVSALRSQRVERSSHSLDDDPGFYDEWTGESSELSDPIEQAFYASARCRLLSAMARLDPVQRQVITLTFEHGMAHAELSAHLKAPLGTVKSWMRRGMARLTEYINEDGMNSSREHIKSLSLQQRARIHY